ncbi:MAG: tryptophan-rich sensory protein [Alphaproteobacteria bacterium]|nr:tryptophan-rich sensory protein [Alphaproteobacteria bacterium]
MVTEPFLAIALIVGSLFLAASSGAIFKPGVWYENLNKPSWNPPDFLFPMAWAVLYIMIGAATFMVWRDAPAGGGYAAMAAFGVQVVFNGAWSAIFFGMKKMGWALIEIVGLWLSIVAMIVTYYPINDLAAYLLLPYLAWVSFAFVLNWKVRSLNPDGGFPIPAEQAP